MKSAPLWRRIMAVADGTKTQRQVAEMLHIAPRRITSICYRAKKRHGAVFAFIKEQTLQPVNKNALWYRAAKLADGTRTYAEIAKELGVPQPVSSRAMRYAKTVEGMEIKINTTKPKDPIIGRVKEMSLLGLTTREIGEKLGLHQSTIQKRVALLEHAGELPHLHARREIAARKRRENHAGKHAMSKTDKPWGRMSDLAERLSDKQLFWLGKQVPDGGTVAEVIAAIVVDAYFEENDE